MSSAFQVVVPPTAEPLGLKETKEFLRIDLGFDLAQDDTVVSAMIRAARTLAEQVTHRALATQTILCRETIERPPGGSLSGPIDRGPDWYRYQEQLGANPFGASQFFFDLPQPPCQQLLSVQTRTTVWEPWLDFTGPTTLDSVSEPARLYFQVPVTANQWQFRYIAGYDGVNFFLPPPLRLCLLEAVAYLYNNREAAALSEGLIEKLLSYRVDWV